MHKDIWKIAAVALCLILLGSMLYCTNGTMAYLTDRDGVKTNSFTFGSVAVDVVEEFNPPDSLKVGTNTYVKKVQLQNTGTVPAYLRAMVMFSDGDVEALSEVSCDGGTSWYKLSELKDHLPNGWAYEGNGVLGGYYYYVNPVQAGGLTPALITNVRTAFTEKVSDTDRTVNQTPRDYDVFVYAEGVQQAKLDGSGLETDWRAAWTTFLEKK